MSCIQLYAIITFYVSLICLQEVDAFGRHCKPNLKNRVRMNYSCLGVQRQKGEVTLTLCRLIQCVPQFELVCFELI